MLSLCRIDAAFRRLYEYDPDFDVSLLSVDESDLTEEDRMEYLAHVRVIRITLVARIADIVKQAATEPASLDAAAAMVEVLISTYMGYSERPGRGYKHALQAIQLLASVYSRFDEAIDLFFDLVERFCALSRTQGTIKANVAATDSAFTTRMMQNYDQTLLKLISKHWNEVGPCGNWDIIRPLERIKSLRDIYEMREGSWISVRSYFRRREAASALFSESQKMLRKVQKQRVVEKAEGPLYGRAWSPKALVSRRSSPTLRSERVSQERSSSENKKVSVFVEEMFEEPDHALESIENQQNVAHMDAFFFDVQSEMKILYTISEKAESCEVFELHSGATLEHVKTTEGPCDTRSRLKFFHHPFKASIAPS